MAPAPSLMVMYAPATYMRGPMMMPRAIASRIATSLKALYTPTSRTVVNPASSVTAALGIAEYAVSTALLCNTLRGSASARSARCVWQSMRPGRTVIVDRSMILASGGIFTVEPTASILAPRMRMIGFARTRPAWTSMNLPARMAITAAAAGAATAPALSGPAEQIGGSKQIHRTTDRIFLSTIFLSPA